MLKSEVKIGAVYTAMISGKLTRVKINDTVYQKGYGAGRREVQHWVATNLSTGREVTIKSAAKLRKEVTEPVAVTKLNAKVLATQGGQYAPTVGVSTKAPDILHDPATENGVEPISTPSLGSLVTERTRPFPSPTPVVTVTTPSGEVPKKWSMADKLRAQKDSGVDNSPHLIVEARAGTGKTTTLVEGLKRVKGIPSSLTPSPQQAKVWDSMSLSKGRVQSIAFVAFNKSIATELQERMPEGCQAMTLHSLGNKAVTRAFGRLELSNYRVSDIISELLGQDIRELRKYKPVLLKATEDLVALCKQNLTLLVGDPTEEGADIQELWEAELDKLAGHYDVELNGSRSEVYKLVPKVLERCKDVQRDKAMDFNDMIWLPIALNLPLYRYDLLLVDEAQDLNRCQQQLAIRSGRRLILCGDPRQAIYGFAGADAESMPRMATMLSETERGVTLLPLTVTRRCGKAIVDEARKIVPDFEAFPQNGEGKISRASYQGETSLINTTGQEEVLKPSLSYRSQVNDGDFILCRVNAPLVGQCFRFLKEGRKANIQGRDIGQGLIRTLDKLMKGYQGPEELGLVELTSRLSDWHHSEVAKENAKRNPSEQKLISLEDRRECLSAFCEDAKTVADVKAKIEKVFTDTSSGGIRLSSIHRAKGLESKRVFFLMPKGAECPHPMARSAWQKGQEMNLKYVGITRAIEELIFVS